MGGENNKTDWSVRIAEEGWSDAAPFSAAPRDPCLHAPGRDARAPPGMPFEESGDEGWPASFRPGRVPAAPEPAGAGRAAGPGGRLQPGAAAPPPQAARGGRDHA